MNDSFKYEEPWMRARVGGAVCWLIKIRNDQSVWVRSQDPLPESFIFEDARWRLSDHLGRMALPIIPVIQYGDGAWNSFFTRETDPLMVPFP